MEVKLNRSEINLIMFALCQKVDLLKNSCMNQQKIIKSLENKKNTYDTKEVLEVVKMMFEDNSIELENYLKVLEKLKKL